MPSNPIGLEFVGAHFFISMRNWHTAFSLILWQPFKKGSTSTHIEKKTPCEASAHSIPHWNWLLGHCLKGMCFNSPIAVARSFYSTSYPLFPPCSPVCSSALFIAFNSDKVLKHKLHCLHCIDSYRRDRSQSTCFFLYRDGALLCDFIVFYHCRSLLAFISYMNRTLFAGIHSKCCKWNKCSLRVQEPKEIITFSKVLFCLFYLLFFVHSADLFFSSSCLHKIDTKQNGENEKL